MSQYRKGQIINKLIFTAVALLLAGMILLALDYPNIKMHLFGPVVFESLEPNEIKAGLIVEASIDTNFGSYAYTDSFREEDVYYVIWTGDAYAEDYRYMGIKVPASEQSAMEEMAEAASNGKYTAPVKYTGIIHRMTSKEYSLFEACFREAGWTEEEIEESTLPYIMNVSYMEEEDNSGLYIFVGICLMPMLILVWCMKWNSDS